MSSAQINELAVPIDREHLAQYTLGCQELERELLALFAEQAPNYVDQMRTAADQTAWKNAAHSLKGSARAIGATVVGMEAERLERLDYARDKSERLSLMRVLEDAMETVVHHIEARDETI